MAARSVQTASLSNTQPAIGVALVGRYVGRTVLHVEGGSLQLSDDKLDVGFAPVGVGLGDDLRRPLVVHACRERRRHAVSTVSNSLRESS